MELKDILSGGLGAGAAAATRVAGGLGGLSFRPDDVMPYDELPAMMAPKELAPLQQLLGGADPEEELKAAAIEEAEAEEVEAKEKAIADTAWRFEIERDTFGNIASVVARKAN